MATAALTAGSFYGQTQVRYRASGLTVAEVEHRAGRVLPEHAHEHAFFNVLVAGGYHESDGRRVLRYRPGVVGFHPAFLTHRDQVDEGGGRFLTVEMSAGWLDRTREVGPLPERAALLPAPAAWIARRLREECATPAAGQALAVEALATELLVLAMREGAPGAARRPRWLGGVRETLEAQPLRRWTLSEVAAALGVHPVHLARAVRRWEGRPLGDLARETRIRAAARLLEEKGRSVADVAAQAGFADQSHFTRVFRRLTGTTPAAYRRR
jgi:AraC family transcriptional regulator